MINRWGDLLAATIRVDIYEVFLLAAIIYSHKEI